MSSSTLASTIPRFLLPQRGLIWQRAASRTTAATKITTSAATKVRSASSTTDKPRVLEKPERFNPPSHGSRLPKKQTPRHYGGELSAAEKQAQQQRDYPKMMPPPGTWGHWIWSSRWVHLVLTLGTLSGLAIYTFTENFRRNSPFVDMVPSASEFLWHPISATRQLASVIRLDSMHNAAIVDKKRKMRVDDVEKRAAYRRAHGLSDEQGFFSQKKAEPVVEEVTAVDDASPVKKEAEQ